MITYELLRVFIAENPEGGNILVCPEDGEEGIPFYADAFWSVFRDKSPEEFLKPLGEECYSSHLYASFAEIFLKEIPQKDIHDIANSMGICKSEFISDTCWFHCDFNKLFRQGNIKYRFAGKNWRQDGDVDILLDAILRDVPYTGNKGKFRFHLERIKTEHLPILNVGLINYHILGDLANYFINGT
jgi:hypothetical protein